MKLYLANSTFRSRGFDFLLTIEAAAREGFRGVQLYLDEEKARDADLIGKTARAARERELEIVVHLPDAAPPECITAAHLLLRHQRHRRAIVHYPCRGETPFLKGIGTGLENSIAGLDERYYARLFRAVERSRAFLAFDLPRLFARRADDRERLYVFARHVLSGMSGNDFLHLIDQRTEGCGREGWVPLGEGLLAPLMGVFLDFAGGIVFEYERLEMATASRDVLLSGRTRR